MREADFASAANQTLGSRLEGTRLLAPSHRTCESPCCVGGIACASRHSLIKCAVSAAGQRRRDIVRRPLARQLAWSKCTNDNENASPWLHIPLQHVHHIVSWEAQRPTCDSLSCVSRVGQRRHKLTRVRNSLTGGGCQSPAQPPWSESWIKPDRNAILLEPVASSSNARHRPHSVRCCELFSV